MITFYSVSYVEKQVAGTVEIHVPKAKTVHKIEDHPAAEMFCTGTVLHDLTTITGKGVNIPYLCLEAASNIQSMKGCLSS